MEDQRREKVEALEVLVEFNGRLVKNIGILVKELSGNRLDDTDNFLQSIINAINWEIKVMNGTMDVLNEGQIRIDKDSFNQSAVALGKAVASKDDAKMAEAFANITPAFEQLGKVAGGVLK